jgi:hypothetical protein
MVSLKSVDRTAALKGQARAGLRTDIRGYLQSTFMNISSADNRSLATINDSHQT